jgi:C1A family cysteine protease
LAAGFTGYSRLFIGTRESPKDTRQIGSIKSCAQAIPGSVDLRSGCSPIEDRDDLGACTANAGVGLIDYFERRAFGKHLDASRLFLYKATRTLAGDKGDSGAQLRDTMKALMLFCVSLRGN